MAQNSFLSATKSPALGGLGFGRVPESLKPAINLGLELLFPVRCVICERFGLFLCPRCQRRLFPVKIVSACPLKKCRRLTSCFRFCPAHKPKPLDGRLSLADYRLEKVRKIISAYKFHPLPQLGQIFGRRLARHLKKWASPRVLVCPIPLHGARQRARGFNQAEIIARALAQKVGVNFFEPLARSKRTRAQARIDSSAKRRENVAGAFRLRWGSKRVLKGKTVWLVDDVITTGATAQEATKKLKQAGARSVIAVTVARG